MSDTKRQIRSLLNRLPDDCTLEDVQYHLHVIQKIERGLADIEAGRVIPHSKLLEMTKTWRARSTGAKSPRTISSRSSNSSRATRKKTRAA